jgi:hypothetical protein
MRTRILAVGFTIAALVLPARAAPAPPEKERPSADDAAKAVNDELAKLKADAAVVQPVKDEAVNRAFPKFQFIGVYFRQYPVARVVPEGLNVANLYAVGPDGKLQLMKDPDTFHAFMTANLGPAKDDDAAKDAARAYVRLAEEMWQDGFFKYKLEDDSTKVEPTDDGKNASARAVVTAGGNGEIGATLAFDKDGKYKEAKDSIRLKPGPRPICQATKLLDADPVVRKMAERDLLIMGRAAKPYLDEQRAKAPPELQQAIDRIWRQIQEEDR